MVMNRIQFQQGPVFLAQFGTEEQRHVGGKAFVAQGAATPIK